MGKKLKDNDFDELQCLQCTVPMVDSVTHEDAFETQILNLAGETQVLDDPDEVVNMCTQLLDDCGNEVIDNDGGESDGTEVLDDCAELSDDDSLKRVGTCPMDQGSKLHTTISDQDDGGFKGKLDNGQWSSGSGQKNFTSVRAATLRASGLAARSMAFRGTKSEPSSIKSHSHSFKQQNAKDNGTTLARNSSALGEAVDLEDFSGECNEEMEEMKGSRNENKCRVGSSIVRRLFMDDTPAEIEGPNNCTNNATGGADLPQLPARGNEMAGLSYVDSQEPGELSQDNALDFVDRFLKFNAIDFDEGGDIGRSTGGKSKPVSRTKHTQSLARKTNLKISSGESGIFDWDDSREDERGGEFFTKKKEAFFNDGGRRKRSFTEPQKLRHYSKRRGAVDGTRDNEEGLDVLQKPKDLVNSNPGVVLQSSKWNKKIVEVTEIKSDKNLTKELDEQLIIGSSDGKEAMLDVGFDTQMAAEAMEALCFGLNAANCDDSHNTNQGTKNLNEGSSRGEKKNKALSRTYFRRKRSNSSCSGILTRSLKQTKSIGTKLIDELNVSARKHAKNARKQCVSEFERKELKKDKSNGNTEEVPSEGSGQMEVERALRNDIDEVDRCHAIASSSGCISAKKSHSQEQACTFTPIACRTRRRTMRNRVSTVVASHDYGEAGTLNDRRQGGSADSDAFTLLSRIEKLSKLNSNRSGELENAQLTDQDKSHRIWNGTIAAVRNGDLRRTRRKLPGDSGQLNGSCNGHRSVDRLVGQENNGQSLGKTQRSEITASSPSMDLGLKRKTRASAHVDPVLPTLDKGGSGFADLVCNSVDGNVVPKDVAGALTAKRSDRQTDADTISAGEGTGGNAKLEVSPGERSKPSGSASATPANCTSPVNAASPICVGDEYLKQSRRKNLSRSFLKREINSLISNSPDGTSTTRDSRRRREMANVRVLFSHHLDEDIIKQQQKILARLGASVVSSISEATHFVTDKFVRTRNILEAIAFGKPVVTHLWIKSCGQASCFIDERNYILRDAKKEKEFGFSLPVSLERACQCPLLQGRKVLVTPNAKPGKELLASLVKAVRGQAVERIGRSALKDDKIPDGLLVLSCEEDYALCLPFLEKGAAVYSSELLLNGIVTQKLEFERHRLFVDWFKNTQFDDMVKSKTVISIGL